VTIGFALTGAVIAGYTGIGEMHLALPLVLFYVLLLLNTYFSVRCFSSVPESESSLQVVINVLLSLIYAGLAALFQNPPAFVWLTILLFFVAALKYALIDSKEFSNILRRKTVIDLVGGIWCTTAFGALSYSPASYVLWIWFVGFIIGNIYVLLGSTHYVPHKN
jgi:hypothetical protein